MATSPTAMAHPVPLSPPDKAPVDLQHPMPDLQSLQGAYIGNIERLEEHAERMSEKGSDLGEEIRKLHEEQKLSDSRRSSLLSGGPLNDEPPRPFTTRSRGCSTSSYTNSIVDVNGAARWGGYSPNGYITSPAGSLRSGSGSQSMPAIQRQRSGSKASRLGQIVHAEEVEEAPTPTSESQEKSSQDTERKVSSFTRQYDQIAQDIHDELRNSVAFAEHYDAQQEYDSHAYADFPDRPPTAASVDTTHMRSLWQDFDGAHCPDTVPEEGPISLHGGSRQSSRMKPPPDLPPQGVPPPGDNMVFYPAPVPKMLNLPKRLSQMPAATVQARRRTQLLESMQAENRKSAPWLPNADANTSNASRDSIPMADPNGQSAKAKRKSRMSMANLPPQLRASAYFDQIPPAQEYEVKGESAEDTLNNILEASAHAPVSAFTDHPFAGHVGEEVYGKEHKGHKKNKSQAKELEKSDNRKSKGSLHLLDTRRNSSGDPLNKLKKRNSSADLNMLTVRTGESRMSLGDELDQHDPDARGPSLTDDDTPRRHSFEDGHHENVGEEIEGEEDEEDEGPQYFGPPTTLLAELQMRKQQQKTRNLTAATAFPNGMHATLLELDAVAEIERKKRKGQKVNLAWEAQAAHDEEDESDDDVPLGVLFPGRDSLVNKRSGGAQQRSDWDRPLGLMAQRELEDNEPLSLRRNRLLGNKGTRDRSPLKRQTQTTGDASQTHLEVPTTTTPGPESEEDEGETLAQRMRRMKNRQALDDAIGDVRKSTVSGDFAAELKSQFGVPEDDKPKPTAPLAGGDGEEETLGQRRARLQAEALARGDANPLGSRPPLRGSMSMADVLGANPINPNNQARKVSEEQLLSSLPPGSLLRQNAEKQERRRISRMDLNNRTSSHELDQPLLGDHVGKPSEDLPIAAKIQAYKDKLSGQSTPMTDPARRPSMMLNSQVMPGTMPSGSTMNLSGQRDSFFPQQGMPMMGMNNMGMSGGYGGMNMMAPQMMAPQMMNPQMMNPQLMAMSMNMMGTPIAGMQGMTYPSVGGMGAMGGMGGMGGMRQSSTVNLSSSMQMGNMGGGMGGVMMMEPPMDPKQRSAIDRWRQGVAP